MSGGLIAIDVDSHFSKTVLGPRSYPHDEHGDLALFCWRPDEGEGGSHPASSALDSFVRRCRELGVPEVRIIESWPDPHGWDGLKALMDCMTERPDVVYLDVNVWAAQVSNRPRRDFWGRLWDRLRGRETPEQYDARIVRELQEMVPWLRSWGTRVGAIVGSPISPEYPATDDGFLRSAVGKLDWFDGLGMTFDVLQIKSWEPPREQDGGEKRWPSKNGMLLLLDAVRELYPDTPISFAPPPHQRLHLYNGTIKELAVESFGIFGGMILHGDGEYRTWDWFHDSVFRRKVEHRGIPWAVENGSVKPGRRIEDVPASGGLPAAVRCEPDDKFHEVRQIVTRLGVAAP